jgi:hypothetical protein
MPIYQSEWMLTLIWFKTTDINILN